jgi:hypothetical protein
VISKASGNEFSLYDRLVVYSSSLFIVGGVFWVPAFYLWAWKRFRSIPKDEKKRRAVYATILLSVTALFAIGPHRNARVGEWLQVRKWSLWKSWLRFFAFEVVADQGYDSIKNLLEEQAIVAVSPHGLFPFGLFAAAVNDTSEKAFGRVRVVVASATQMIPWVRDLTRWMNCVYVVSNCLVSLVSAHLSTRTLLMLYFFRFTLHNIVMHPGLLLTVPCQRDVESDWLREGLQKCLKDIRNTSLTRTTNPQLCGKGFFEWQCSMACPLSLSIASVAQNC